MSARTPHPRRLLVSAACALLPLAVAGCGGANRVAAGDEIRARVECAPFARTVTGLRLSGDADAWWNEARGRYQRAFVPVAGSVLVFRRSARLPHGHVSVVSRVLSPRRILVTDANWMHGRITEDQPVIDVSPANDWTSVRVWWPPSGQMGTAIYATDGFILNDRPLSHDAIDAAAASWNGG